MVNSLSKEELSQKLLNKDIGIQIPKILKYTVIGEDDLFAHVKFVSSFSTRKRIEEM